MKNCIELFQAMAKDNTQLAKFEEYLQNNGQKFTSEELNLFVKFKQSLHNYPLHIHLVQNTKQFFMEFGINKVGDKVPNSKGLYTETAVYREVESNGEITFGMQVSDPNWSFVLDWKQMKAMIDKKYGFTRNEKFDYAAELDAYSMQKFGFQVRRDLFPNTFKHQQARQDAVDKLQPASSSCGNYPQ